MAKKLRLSSKFFSLISMIILSAILLSVVPAAAEYAVTNLVSDVSGLANFTDSQLINPWGITYSPTSPFWVSNNGSGLVTLYDGAGVKQGSVVTIPGGTPTGAVFNGTSGFNSDLFLFATAGGTITGWRSALGTTSEIAVDNSGAVYTGLALGNNLLFAANFAAGTIDVFSNTFALITGSGSFTDPNLPVGYAPFNVQNLNGNLFVTYALVNSGSVVPGAGNGIVDVFDTSGNLLSRLISNGGALNAPWGLALAPGEFGQFGNALLVANSGDGKINAFDATTGVFLGTLTDADGNPITIDGLKGLIFGNGGNGGNIDTLFFTAGPYGEQRSLFGSVAPVPPPPSVWLLGSGLLSLLGWKRIKKS
jgi:uncharacterized protein (TIGR03118 family)